MKVLLENLSCYQVDLKLIPEEQFINAKVRLAFHVPTDKMSKAIFCLHRQLVVQSVVGEHLAGYRYDTDTSSLIPFIPEAGTLHLQFSRPLKRGEKVELNFEYEGRITAWPVWSANVISDVWTELGLYLPWFPYNGEYGDFTFSVNVDIDAAYQVRSYGDHARDATKWHFVWGRPASDMVIVASRDLKTKTIKVGGWETAVHYVTLSESTASMLGEDLSWILERFGSWFGGEKTGRMSLVESPRQQGGGYARSGLIVLGGLDNERYVENREEYFRYLAHETAHNWWRGAKVTSWEDWLNESFAEYSALLAVRDRFGRAAFEKRMAEKIEAQSNVPPIWNLDRGDNDRWSTEERKVEIEAVLYRKGPVVLHKLEMSIGYEGFLAVCREMVLREVRSTAQFLEVLGCLEGEEVRKWVEEMLKTKGQPVSD